MAKAVKRKKAAYRRRNQNRLSMVLVALTVTLITIAVAMSSVGLVRRNRVLTEETARLEQEIEMARQRADEIEEFRKYTHTKRYVEKVAKDKLGLVYDGEVLFKEEN